MVAKQATAILSPPRPSLIETPRSNHVEAGAQEFISKGKYLVNGQVEPLAEANQNPPRFSVNRALLGLLLGLSTRAHPRGLPAGDPYMAWPQPVKKVIGGVSCRTPAQPRMVCRCASIHERPARDDWRPTRPLAGRILSASMPPVRAQGILGLAFFARAGSTHAPTTMPEYQTSPLMSSIGTLTS